MVKNGDDGTKARIMLVEDMLETRFVFKSRLKKLGYEVVASVGKRKGAITKAKQTNPDLILIDIDLGPGKEFDGIYLAKEIREKLNIPVVYLTVQLGYETIDKAIATEPLGYIVKDTILDPEDEETGNKILDIPIKLALKIQKLLKEKEILLEMVPILRKLESTTKGVIETDTGNHVIFMNNKAEELTGWDRVEAAGKPVDEVLSIADKSLTRRDGEELSIVHHSSPILDSAQNKIAYVHVFHVPEEDKGLETGELYTQKSAMSKLEEEQERLKKIRIKDDTPLKDLESELAFRFDSVEGLESFNSQFDEKKDRFNAWMLHKIPDLPNPEITILVFHPGYHPPPDYLMRRQLEKMVFKRIHG
ncbi:MAG: response regulator [Thermoplasmata archaeon]|nr:response regulator [Thermoplasmata archaeon]